MEDASHSPLRPLDLVGPGADRYAKAFARFEARGGRWAPSWNFAAFFASTAWFAYRRMWFWAAANALLVALVMLAGLHRPADLGADRPVLDNPRTFVIWACLLTTFLGLPFCANWFYFRSLMARMARANADPESRASRATAPLACVLVLVTITTLQWTFIQAAPPSARERIAMAMLMASQTLTRISEFHETHGRLPLAHESAAFGSTFVDQEARSIAYDAGRSMVVITLSGPFEGRRFGYQAEARGGILVWTCRNIDMNRRFLPSRCLD